MRKDKIFQQIGRLTIQFATLEHRLQGLLETLMGDGNIMIGPLFIHNMALATLLRKIRLVARCKISQNTEFLARLNRTLKKIDALREERNLLIHGDWTIETEETFRITVRDFKFTCEAGSWKEFTETSFSEKKLNSLIRRLEGLGHEVDFLIRSINQP